MTASTSLLPFLLTLTLLTSGCSVNLDGLRGYPADGADKTEHHDVDIQPSDAGKSSMPPDAYGQALDTDTPTVSPDAEPLQTDTETSPISLDADSWTTDTGAPIIFPDAGNKPDVQPSDLNPASNPDSTPDRAPPYELGTHDSQSDSTTPPKDLQPRDIQTDLKPLGSPCSISCTSQPQICECASGFCDLWSSNTHTCSNKLPLGAKCDTTLVCESEICMNGKCVPECYPVCRDAG